MELEMQSQLPAIVESDTQEQRLIVVTQLPVIKERLHSVKADVERYVAEALAMECNEDTYKDVKKRRAELRAKLTELEQARKQVKAQIEGPYKDFEAVYRECVSATLEKADKQLAERISLIENQKKQQKLEMVKAYFCEYMQSVKIPDGLISFDRAGISVKLSDSDKSLRDAAQRYIDGVRGDLDVIETMEDKAEVLVEYQQRLNLSQAVTIVRKRHEEIERQRQKYLEMQENEARAKAAAEAVAQAVEESAPLYAPAQEAAEEETVQEAPAEEAPVDQRVISCCFRVIAPIDKMRALKKFLIDGGYDYASIHDPDNQ